MLAASTQEGPALFVPSYPVPPTGADAPGWMAFSSDGFTRTCVDCGERASHLISYAEYSVGDLVCTAHARIRKSLISDCWPVVVPLEVRIVPFYKEAST